MDYSENPLGRGLRSALRIRAFEKVLLEEFGKGGIRGTVHTCLGQELVPALIVEFLDQDDKVFGTHRGHGYFLSLTEDFRGLAAEILGKESGCSRGIGGSQHLYGNQILTNGIQGGLVPVGAGFALGQSSGIAIVVIGDGSLGQGIVYETLNFASVFAIPLLILLEDNGIAQSTPSNIVFRGDVSQRAKGFDVRYFEANDTAPRDLRETIASSVDFVRDSRKPAMLHIKTRRLGPHSKGDDNRSEQELEELQSRDPLEILLGKNPSFKTDFERDLDDMRDMFRSVALEEPALTHFDENVWRRKILESARLYVGKGISAQLTLRQQIRQSLSDLLEKNEAVAIFGEDIETLPAGMHAPYQGAFGVTGGLSEQFPGRVRNSPISEQALVGFGAGRALSGRPTVVEIMFGDFTTLIVDQIRQQATKMTWMFGRFIAVPLVVRTTTGGRRGYGPTHSQNLEGMFLGIPNLNVFCASPFGLPTGLFEFLISTGFPSIVFEDKDLYGLPPLEIFQAGYELHTPSGELGPLILRAKGRVPVLTVLSYGYSSLLVTKAAHKLAVDHEIFIDLVTYQFLSPLDEEELVKSARLTGKILIVEEGSTANGIAGTVLSRISQTSALPEIVIRALSGQSEIGASETSESAAKLSVELIVEKCLAVVNGGSN